MTERITIGLQKAAVTLADSRDYRSAAEQLNVSEAELRTQIAALEEALSLKVFSVDGQHVEVTAAGALFVAACRTFLATRNQDQH